MELSVYSTANMSCGGRMGDVDEFEDSEGSENEVTSVARRASLSRNRSRTR